METINMFNADLVKAAVKKLKADKSYVSDTWLYQS